MSGDSAVLEISREPTVSGIYGARDVQIINSNISVVGGDSHARTHVHCDGTKDCVKILLDGIDNLRKVQQVILAKATPGTLEWLFKTEFFRLWWAGACHFMIVWGYGMREPLCPFQLHRLTRHLFIAGAGKSILV